jgi:hypothetical protein
MSEDRSPRERASRRQRPGIAQATTGRCMGRQTPSPPSRAGIAGRREGSAYDARRDRVGHAFTLRGPRDRTSWAARIPRGVVVSGWRPDVLGTRGRRANRPVAGSQPAVPTESGIARPVVRRAKATSQDDDPHMTGSRSQHERIAMPSCAHRDPNVRDTRVSLLAIAIPARKDCDPLVRPTLSRPVRVAMPSFQVRDGHVGGRRWPHARNAMPSCSPSHGRRWATRRFLARIA